MLTLLLACAAPQNFDSRPTLEDSEAPAIDHLAEVELRLAGRFDSADQADSNPSYYAVSLIACEVDAPELGEHVLYIEQALVDQLDSPYRQRLYVLSEEDEGLVRSSIYELNREKKAVGLCDEEELRSFLAEDVVEREGCDVLLEFDGQDYAGSTGLESCPSDLNGATWATSEVFLGPDRIESWDRGWDAEGQQIWGATDGAYVFLRRE